MSDTTQPPTRGGNHSPMRSFRIKLLSSSINDDLYTETINTVSLANGGSVNDNEVVVKRGAIGAALTLLQESDEGGELYAELIISPLPPEKRGYKKAANEGSAALEALKAKLGG